MILLNDLWVFYCIFAENYRKTGHRVCLETRETEGILNCADIVIIDLVLYFREKRKMGFYFQSSSQQNFSCAHWFLLSPAVTLCWIHMAFLSIGTTQTRKLHQGELICIFWQSYLIDWPRGVGKILFPTLMHCTELKHLFLSFKFLPIIHRNGWPLVVKFKGLFRRHLKWLL